MLHELQTDTVFPVLFNTKTRKYQVETGERNIITTTLADALAWESDFCALLERERAEYEDEIEAQREQEANANH